MSTNSSPFTQLTDRDSIPAVLAELTLDEKISLLRADSAIRSTALPEHGIPSLVLTDGVTGINFSQLVLDYIDRCPDPTAGTELIPLMALGAEPMEALEARLRGNPALEPFLEALRVSRHGGKQYLCFPSGINIGASFDPDRAYAIGQAVGWEMRDSGVDVCLGPNVDLMRDPLGGRNYEMYGEDPFLVSQIGAAFIRGLQSTGVAACAKHLFANNQETRRNSVDTRVSKRTLMELYTAPFRAAVQDGGVQSMMSSLNSVNGQFSSYNRELLSDWAREDWGFEGVIVSDWGAATAHPARAIAAGLDQVLPGHVDMSELYAALEEGRLSMETIDAAVRRMLTLIVDLKTRQAQIPAVYDREALCTANRQAVLDGAVLLKNDADLLPLRDERVVFWGSHSRQLIPCGTGSTEVHTAQQSHPYEATRALLGEERVRFEDWDGAQVLVYTASAEAGEGADRGEMDLEPGDRAALPRVLREAKARGLRTVVLLNVPGPVDCSPWIADADAVLCLFLPGSEGGHAAAQLLTGAAEPGGRLPVTFPLHAYDTPAYPNFPGEHDEVLYGEELFIGYRHYDLRRLPTAFPFGHGLSYTRFSQRAAVDSVCFDLRQQERVEIPVTVTNTGDRPGSQVIQLYLAEQQPRLRRPLKELKSFCRVHLEPGESRTVSLTLRRGDLACFDARLDQWVTPVGAYRLFLATSAEALFAELPMTVTGPNPYVLGPHSPLGEVMARPEAVAVLERHFPAFRNLGGHLRMMSSHELGALLTSYLIRGEPDANRLSALLDPLYAELAALG